MNISFRGVKNFDLNNKIKALASEERKLTATILAHIAEVDRRKLFLDLAYPSLFEYLTREIGYSAGSAQRRIDAARLLHSLPEVAHKIEAGTLNLNQISKLQQACREIKKITGSVVSVAQRRSVLTKIDSASPQKTDLILAQEFGIPAQQKERKCQQADESVRVELTFSKEEMVLIEKAKELISNKGGATLKDSLVQMAELTISKYQPKKVEFSADLKSVTPALKKVVIGRDQHCQFVDHKSGNICGSKYFLEVDHIQPKFAGGSNQLQNLRVLCRNHNQNRYHLQSFIKQWK